MSPTPIPRRALFLSLFPLLLASAAAADPVEAKVSAIRALYNEIEGAELRTKRIEFESQDEPLSGTCTLHYRGDELVKIHLAYGFGDHGASDEYHYYDRGSLFFVYASDGSWGFTGQTLPNGESETIDSVTEHRLYLGDGTILRHLEKKASSKNPASLKGLLAKAANGPAQDASRGIQLVRHGQRAVAIRDAAGAIAVLTAGE